MPFFGGFTFVTDITLWRCWSTVSSSNNVSVAAVSATNDLHLCCSTFIRLLYWDSTSEYEETWLILSKLFPMSQSHFFAVSKIPAILFWSVDSFVCPSHVRL